MKAFVVLIGIIIFTALNSYCVDDNTCLKVKGIVLDKNGKKLDSLKITLLEEGKVISTMDAKSPFKIELARNHYYSLVISRRGYCPSLIVFDTSVPSNHPQCNFQYQFEYNLVEENNNYDKNYLEFPSAIIKYKKADDVFIHSEKYNKHIKKLVGMDAQ